MTTTTACMSVRLLAAVSPFMAMKDVRYYLNGLRLEPLNAGDPAGIRAVATDGHVLGIVTDASACWHKDAKPVIVPRALVDSILKGAKPGDEVTLQFNDASDVVPGSDENSGVEIVASIGNRKFFGRAIDGRFPDYATVVPQGEMSNEPAYFNPELIERFVKSAKSCMRFGAAGTRYVPWLQLQTQGERSAVIALCGLVDGFAAGGVIMPVRAKGAPDAQTAVRALLPGAPAEREAEARAA